MTDAKGYITNLSRTDKEQQNAVEYSRCISVFMN